ncbi:MAG: amidohydrolase, partial [Saprospiraceae bacterium]|nr:amidohydrolase [Saprospiraceae bacterium]
MEKIKSGFFFPLLTLLLIGLPFANAQEEPSSDSTQTNKKKGLPLEAARTFQLKTDEGTWINLDVSPDGQTIAFDLMGDIYTLPISGGKAEQLTSGMAYDTHPKYSPDGQSIAFTSDRSGSENIWILETGEEEPRQLTKDDDKYYQSAEWTPDGDYLIVAKGIRALKLHLFHKDGGGGTQLIKEPEGLKTIEPAFGPQERYIWFSQRTSDWSYNADLPEYQLATYDRQTGERDTKTSRYGSAFAPTLSPDGKWLVYGTRYEAETGLIRRNLDTGEEEWLAYPVQRDEQESRARLGVYPAMSFTPDSKYLIAYYGGKIWKLPIQGGDGINIPFEVDVELDFGPEVIFDYPVEDDPQMVVTQIRDAALSPDGKHLAFTALNRLYVMNFPDGEPRRLVREDHTVAMPSWSADNRHLAYVSWEGEEGHIYKIDAVDGGDPVRLTSQGAFYSQPAWDAESDRIAFLTGPARAFTQSVGPQASGALENLAWIPASGGDMTVIAPANGRSHPHFVDSNDRIYLYHGEKGLLSIRWDGTDEKNHLKVTGINTYPALHYESHGLLINEAMEPERKPSSPSVILMAPRGDRALAQINNDIYVVTVPMVGGETPSI